MPRAPPSAASPLHLASWHSWATVSCDALLLSLPRPQRTGKRRRKVPALFFLDLWFHPAHHRGRQAQRRTPWRAESLCGIKVYELDRKLWRREWWLSGIKASLPSTPDPEDVESGTLQTSREANYVGLQAPWVLGLMIWCSLEASVGH